MIKELYSKLLKTKNHMESKNITKANAVIVLTYEELVFIQQLVEIACFMKLLSKGDSK